jgi:hypothetical protein
MSRRRAGVLLAAICLSAVIASPAVAGTHPANVSWKKVAAKFAWPVLRPTDTAGLHLTGLTLKSSPCDDDYDYQQYTATYGSIPGRWFELYAAKRELCGDGPDEVRFGHVVIRGHRASVSVWYPRDLHEPTLADAYRYGLSLDWREGATDISFAAFHLRLAEAVRIARSLRPVSG